MSETKGVKYLEFCAKREQFARQLLGEFQTEPVPSSLELSAGLWPDTETIRLLNNERWNEVKLARFQYYSLEFFGVRKQAILYYLPAMMLSVLEYYDDEGGNLNDTMTSVLRIDNFWKISAADFSESQRTLICQFLHILDEYDFTDSFEEELGTKIIQYWCSDTSRHKETAC